jgi:hypothetical protein
MVTITKGVIPTIAKEGDFATVEEENIQKQ